MVTGVDRLVLTNSSFTSLTTLSVNCFFTTCSQTSIHSSPTRHVHPFYFTSVPAMHIFVPGMALLDLDKIIVKRTVVGIRCASCGGNLAVKKRSALCYILKIISFGAVKLQKYECENCK